MTLRRTRAGFSLMEITVAIGVIAFGLIAILGLLPVGMKSGREAIDATRTSLIAQDVFNRVRASTMSNIPGSPFYYGPYTPNVASFSTPRREQELVSCCAFNIRTTNRNSIQMSTTKRTSIAQK